MADLHGNDRSHRRSILVNLGKAAAVLEIPGSHHFILTYGVLLPSCDMVVTKP
jgi:hypothetical protein